MMIMAVRPHDLSYADRKERWERFRFLALLSQSVSQSPLATFLAWLFRPRPSASANNA